MPISSFNYRVKNSGVQTHSGQLNEIICPGGESGTFFFMCGITIILMKFILSDDLLWV